MSDDELIIFGPIRAKHLSGGWRFDGDEHDWWLSKHIGTMTARIRATTPTTCSWTVYGPGGQVLREASWDDVDEAKEQAEQWMHSRRVR